MTRLFTASDKPAGVEDLWHGGHLFLVCSGPSLELFDLTLLDHPGIMTMGCNNSPVKYRPNFWTMVDDVKNFCKSIYQDPKIMKFIPHPKRNHKLWDNIGWKESQITPANCPGVLYYKRSGTDHGSNNGNAEWFRPETFFTDDDFCWGNHAQRCHCGHWKSDKKTKECPECGHKNRWGSRTVFLVMIRLAHVLGFRHVYLLGCDFKMQEEDQNYAFEQGRSKQSIRNNNNTYRILNLRMADLLPEIRKQGMEIYNCYADSGLTAFPYLDYNVALARALAWMPAREHTAGLYDRKANKGRYVKQDNEPVLNRMKVPQVEEVVNQLTLDEWINV